ncbi:prohead core scaffolding protein and protease [Tenacibaculum phage PTm1]|uniref:Prohead core scaffolding protein and protease n=2 Tax=Shirahamavirus PTm1 TaxID=2846435 RepID=A0A5S9HYC9_9CAUD|nr:prohead core scaffolding protein and protease [Tenacibaculum phage PTm1]BBI90692.1 prohead core scaffolding protein and protease [Tenacibaculum phage PTm1]BBI90999.1 prohead core scaffolding protein and protease [Tenacibaculum phage PTm5]
MMMVEGVMGRVDTMNRNNRFYPKGEYRRHVEDMTRRINEQNGILGEMEHPKSMNINLNNVSHKVMDVRIDEDGFVRGNILLLDTPKGKIAQSIVRSGSPLPISSRGIGMTSKDGAVTLEYMATYDLVGTAGFAETGLKAISESADENGNVVSEFYEYNVDGNGDVITESALQFVVESVEAKLVAKYDNILGAKSTLSEERVQEIVSEQFTKNVDQVKSFVSENVNENAEQTVTLTESQIQEIIDQRFLNIQVPIIEKWAVTHMLPKSAEIQENWIRTTFTKELSEGIEKWILESILPKQAEITESWIKYDFTKELSEGIEKWIKTDYTKQLSESMENWLKSDFTVSLCEGVESYINESSKEVKSLISEMKHDKEDKEDKKDKDKKDIKEGEEIHKRPAGVKDGEEGDELTNENVNEAVNETPNKSVVSTLLESLQAKINEAKAKRVEAEKANDDKDKEDDNKDKELNESFAGQPKYITAMPHRYHHIWKCLNESQKSTIHRRASIRMMNTNEDIEVFWDSLQLTNETLNIKEGTKAYFRTVNEAVGEVPNKTRASLASMAKEMR